MMNDPTIRYHLSAAAQRERWQEAELIRKARAAIPDQAGLIEQMEAAPDLTGLVEWVIQSIWKRLSLPAREVGFRPDDRRSGRSSGMVRPVHPANVPLQ